MRSLSFILILVPLFIASTGCKGRVTGSSTEEQPLVSTVNAGDPNVASYFANGFYALEGNAWRWTAKNFSVDLAPPLNSNQKGAQLVLKMAVPDAVLQKVNTVELSATVQGYK